MRHPSILDALRAFGTPKARSTLRHPQEPGGTRQPPERPVNKSPFLGFPYGREAQEEARKALGLPPNVRVVLIPNLDMDDWPLSPDSFEKLFDDLLGPRPNFAKETKEVTDTVTDAALHHDNEPEPGPEPEPGTGSSLSSVLTEVGNEVERAQAKHAPMHSPHEGWAVIQEELDELWDEIKFDGGGRDDNARKEAVQVAATAVRYLLDLDPHDD